MLYKDYLDKVKIGEPASVSSQILYFDGEVDNRFVVSSNGDLTLNIRKGDNLNEKLILPAGFRLSNLLEEIVICVLKNNHHKLDSDSCIEIEFKSISECKVYFKNVDCKTVEDMIDLNDIGTANTSKLPTCVVDVLKSNIREYFDRITVSVE